VITLHSKIKARCQIMDKDGKISTVRVMTTPGRHECWPSFCPRHPAIPLDLVNGRCASRRSVSHHRRGLSHCGQKETVLFCDAAMALGFREACKAGISFGKTTWSCLRRRRS